MRLPPVMNNGIRPSSFQLFRLLGAAMTFLRIKRFQNKDFPHPKPLPNISPAQFHLYQGFIQCGITWGCCIAELLAD